MRTLFLQFFGSPQKTAFSVVLLTIVLMGALFRTYHFSEWLHFETDQVDDYFAVAPAVEEGLGKLPVVGPKAAGTDLRLGSLFYIFEFISAQIFGNTPAGHAGATLFFSLLSLPLFYVSARLFFTRIFSLFVLAIFASSPFLILYARFSWNPNSLPFFLLLLIFTLIKGTGTVAPKQQLWWFGGVAVTLAVTMQLHVSALLVAPVVVGTFLLWKRPHLFARTWGGIFLVMGVLFLPTILHEVVTGGQMVTALTDKIDVPSEKNNTKLPVKIVQNFRYHAGNYFLILTGHDAINAGRPDGSSLGLTCRSCKAEAPYRLAGYVFFVLSLFLLGVFLTKEKNEVKKRFLVLLLLWFVFSFLFFFSIMMSGKYLYPRFFLLVGPLPIFFFGLLLQCIDPEKNRMRFVFACVLTAMVMGMSLQIVRTLFVEAEQVAVSETSVVGKEDIFPETGRITLKQQEQVVDFIAARTEGKNEPVYLKSESEYEPSLWLLLEKRNIHFFGPTLSTDPLFEQGQYFFVFRSASSLTKEMKWYAEKFSVVEEIPFGALTVRILTPKPEWVTGKKQDRQEVFQKKVEALAIPRWEMIVKYFN
ncbi:MAG: hypothetical protein Q8O53_03570 [Candidatus Moranbacteria bacterium]|nr:hypothetical protein [Candidatus Moranbacteria bacterium]